MTETLERIVRLLLQSETDWDSANSCLSRYLNSKRIEVPSATKDRIAVALARSSATKLRSPSQRAIREIARGLHICDVADVSFYG